MGFFFFFFFFFFLRMRVVYSYFPRKISKNFIYRPKFSEKSSNFANYGILFMVRMYHKQNPTIKKTEKKAFMMRMYHKQNPIIKKMENKKFMMPGPYKHRFYTASRGVINAR